MQVVFLLFFISTVSGARILGYVPTPSYSHQIVFKPLWRELSLRGHQVTTITTHPINDPSLVNLTEIDFSHLQNNVSPYIVKMFQSSNVSLINGLFEFYRLMIEMMGKQLEDPAVKNLITDPDIQFDLVIVEYLFTSSLAFAERFNCPSIGMLSVDGSNLMYQMIGNPSHTTLYPDAFLPYATPLSLPGRIVSFTVATLMDTFMVKKVQDMEQELVKKYFGDHYPPVYDMARNISMLFVNSDPIFHHVRPLVPAVIQIGGGSHRTSPKPLPHDLQKHLDSASNGFIYFSLGSNVRSELLPPATINILLETFSELPYAVLWKFENDNLQNIPKNVFISKWLPQQSVLKHPNIKLFITQGGLQSIDEAIYEHVPMIGIPFLGDQPYNVKKMVSKGLGLELNHKTLEKEELKRSILEVISNPKYRNTIKRLAELAQDQPMTGLEKAVWWTEYVIRHKGAKHLRSPLLDIPWYQYLLLDVISVLLLTILLTFYTIYLIVRCLIRLVRRKCCKSKTKEKKH